MTNSAPNEHPIQFSLVAGGPFHTLLMRLGLLGPDCLPSWRTAYLLALLAWAPPAILTILQTLVFADYMGLTFFSDGTVYTRYLVAIIIMVATEPFADGRISKLVDQVLKAHLLEPAARKKFKDITISADQQASHPLAEGTILLIALGWSWLSFYLVSSTTTGGWEEWSKGGISHLSWAGTVAELFSNPVFLFLALRWFWRFMVWSLLLFRLSRLPLRLTAIHPDRCGGLMFLALFPGIFGGLVFALSCVVSSSLYKSLAILAPSVTFIWMIIAGWALLMILIFLAPLLFFSPPLYLAREQALIEYGRIAQIHHQAFHKAWVTDGSGNPEELLGSPEPSSVADLNACVQSALDMRFVPVDWKTVVQIVIAALAPFLVVVASQVPLLEVLKWIIGTIF